MSSSNDQEKRTLKTGRVFISADSPGGGETSIQELEGKKRPSWDDDANQALIDRVKKRAAEQASEIIGKAMLEGEEIKRKAYEDGMAEGLAEAQLQFQQEVQAMGQQLGQVLAQIQEQNMHFWAAERQNFVELVRMAVEKTVMVSLSEERVQSLSNLLNESIELIDNTRTLNVRVCQEDEQTMAMLLGEAARNNPRLEQWRVRVDDTLQPGGLVLESEDGIVDNSLNNRYAEVSAILDQLVYTGQPQEQYEEQPEDHGQEHPDQQQFSEQG